MQSSRGPAIFLLLAISAAALLYARFDWRLYVRDGLAVYFLNLYLMLLSGTVIYGFVYFLKGRNTAVVILALYLYMASMPGPGIVARNITFLKSALRPPVTRGSK